MNEQDETIIDMKPDEKGTYQPIAVIRRNPPRIPRRKPPLYELVDGFMYGLDAVERLFYIIKNMDNKFRR